MVDVCVMGVLAYTLEGRRWRYVRRWDISAAKRK